MLFRIHYNIYAIVCAKGDTIYYIPIYNMRVNGNFVHEKQEDKNSVSRLFKQHLAPLLNPPTNDNVIYM